MENCLGQVVSGVSGGIILIQVVEVGRPSHCGWSIFETEDPKLDKWRRQLESVSTQCIAFSS